MVSGPGIAKRVRAEGDTVISRRACRGGSGDMKS